MFKELINEIRRTKTKRRLKMAFRRTPKPARVRPEDENEQLKPAPPNEHKEQ